MSRSADTSGRGELKEAFHMSFGGIDNSTSDYVDWPRLEISVGDRIELEILEDSVSIPPASRRAYERENNNKDCQTTEKEGEQDAADQLPAR